VDAVHMYDALTRGSPGATRALAHDDTSTMRLSYCSPSASGKGEPVYARSCARTTFMLQVTVLS